MKMIISKAIGIYLLFFSENLIATNNVDNSSLPQMNSSTSTQSQINYGTDGSSNTEGYFGPDVVPNLNPGDPGMVDNQNKIFDENEVKYFEFNN